MYRCSICRLRSDRFLRDLCLRGQSRLSNCAPACTVHRRQLTNQAATIFHPRRLAADRHLFFDSIEPTAFARNTFVAAAQDRNPATTGLERPGKFFDDRGLSRAADRQVPDADNQTTERALAENAFAVEIKPELNETFVNKRKSIENPAQNTGAKAVSPLEDDVDPELF